MAIRFFRLPMDNDADVACKIPPATWDGFFVFRVVGVNNMAARGAAATAGFFGGGGGGLAPAGISLTVLALAGSLSDFAFALAGVPRGGDADFGACAGLGLGGGPGGLPGFGGGPGGTIPAGS